jgi:hypothetical protein
MSYYCGSVAGAGGECYRRYPVHAGRYAISKKKVNDAVVPCTKYTCFPIYFSKRKTGAEPRIKNIYIRYWWSYACWRCF